MANIGFSELIVILMILVLVFGASRLPALGESLGKAVRNVKRGLEDDGATAAKTQIADTASVRADADIRDAEIVPDTHSKGEPKS